MPDYNTNIAEDDLNFSVLMSLYYKERPEYLRQSLDSVFSQTLKPSQVVLMKDGPLPAALENVLKDYPQLEIHAIEKNVGLGQALNRGLKYCKFPLVARMDTDDICYPDRFERQINFMLEHPEISICSAWIDEFYDTPDNIVSCRRLPEHHKEISRFAKSRCPLNHPAVVYRKDAILEIGGYPNIPLFEDYYLWAILIVKGYQMYNLQTPVLLFRTSPDMYRRRGGFKYAKDNLVLLSRLRKLGLVSGFEAFRYGLMRSAVFIMPNFIRSWIYLHILH